MAEKPSLQLVAVILLCAAALEIFASIIGFPVDFGIGADLAFLPALIALFAFGYELSFIAALLTFIVLLALGAGWFVAVSRLAAILPFLCIAGYQALSAGGAKLGQNAVNAFLGFFIALLLFIIFSPVIPLESGNPFAPPIIQPMPDLYIPLALGEFLMGAMPMTLLLLFSLFIFLVWAGRREKADAAIFKDHSALGWFLLLALPIRGAATAATYFYYSGPGSTGLKPAFLLSAAHPLVLIAWSAVFGLLEALLAWSLFIIVSRTADAALARIKRKPPQEKPAGRKTPRKKPASKLRKAR